MRTMGCMRIGIDLGTTTGWAVLRPDGTRDASGTWRLDGRHDSHGMRVVRLRARLGELFQAYPGALLGYENVSRHRGVDAAHVYGALRAALMEACEAAGVTYCAVTVQDVKRAAVGNGKASKEEMVAAAVARWGAVADDNEADALWVAECVRVGVP